MPTVLVTGASTGIGRAIATHLAQRGWRVFASVRKDADADALSALGHASLTPVIFDVTDDEAVGRAVAEIDERLDGGGLDGLVNNAGIGIGGPIEHVSLDDWRWQFEVNLFGVVRVTQAFLPALHRAKGRVVNIGSIGGLLTWPMLGPYHASKYAIEAYTDALRAELRASGMHASVIEPGSIQSDIWGKAKQTEAAVDDALSAEARERYGDLATSMAKVTALGSTTASPASYVATTVEHALTSTWPRSRYRVGLDAKFLATVRAVLPDRLFEAFQRLMIAAVAR